MRPAADVAGFVLDGTSLRSEIRKALVLIKVFNLSSLKLHEVVSGSCANFDPNWRQELVSHFLRGTKFHLNC